MPGYSSAERRAAVKKQLRDRKGRWVEMGGKIKFLVNGAEKIGDVVDIDGDYFVVDYPGANGNPIRARVSAKQAEGVRAKASLGRKLGMGRKNKSGDSSHLKTGVATKDKHVVNGEAPEERGKPAIFVERDGDNSAHTDVADLKVGDEVYAMRGLGGRSDFTTANDRGPTQIKPGETARVVSRSDNAVTLEVTDSNGTTYQVVAPNNSGFGSSNKVIARTPELDAQLKDLDVDSPSEKKADLPDAAPDAPSIPNATPAPGFKKGDAVEWDAPDKKGKKGHIDGEVDDNGKVPVRLENAGKHEPDRIKVDVYKLRSREQEKKADAPEAAPEPEKAKTPEPAKAGAPEIDDARRAELDKQISDLRDEEQDLIDFGESPAKIRAVRKKREDLEKERDGRDTKAEAPAAPEAPQTPQDAAPDDSVAAEDLPDLDDGTKIRLSGRGLDGEISDFEKRDGKWVGLDETDQEVELDDKQMQKYLDRVDPDDIKLNDSVDEPAPKKEEKKAEAPEAPATPEPVTPEKAPEPTPEPEPAPKPNNKPGPAKERYPDGYEMDDESDFDDAIVGQEIYDFDGNVYVKESDGSWKNVHTDEKHSASDLLKQDTKYGALNPAGDPPEDVNEPDDVPDVPSERAPAPVTPEPEPAAPESEKKAQGTVGPDEIGYDGDTPYVHDANGDRLYEGSRVRSSKDGLVGEIVKIEGNGKYVKVRGDDGKIRGRRINTLELHEPEDNKAATPDAPEAAPEVAPEAPAPANDLDLGGDAPSGSFAELKDIQPFDEITDPRSVSIDQLGKTKTGDRFVVQRKDGDEGLTFTRDEDGIWREIGGDIEFGDLLMSKVLAANAADSHVDVYFERSQEEHRDNLTPVGGGDFMEDVFKAPKVEAPPVKPGEIGTDNLGRKYVTAGDGNNVYKGSQVKSKTDGLEGTVVGLEGNGNYVKILGNDGKVRGRKLSTLEVVTPEAYEQRMKSQKAPDVAPNPSDDPRDPLGIYQIYNQQGRRPYKVTGKANAGIMGITDFLELENGQKVVRKRIQGRHNYEGADAEAASEVLAGQLANRVLGINGFYAVDAGEDESGRKVVLMPKIDGKMADDAGFDYWKRDGEDGRMKLKNAREIGLLDYLIANSDRHEQNWMVQDHADGTREALPIDHGGASWGNYDYGSPFANYFIKNMIADKRGSSFTKAEIDNYITKLRAMKSEFDKFGKHEWYYNVMKKLEKLKETAK